MRTVVHIKSPGRTNFTCDSTAKWYQKRKRRLKKKTKEMIDPGVEGKEVMDTKVEAESIMDTGH